MGIVEDLVSVLIEGTADKRVLEKTLERQEFLKKMGYKPIVERVR